MADQGACQVPTVDTLIKKDKDKDAYNIYIYSFSNAEGSYISFPAFLKDFNDSYKSDWNAQRVLGKMDPIATFKNTTRSVTIQFEIPSESFADALTNLNNIDYIIKGLYPVYDSGLYGTSVMASPPYFRIKFSNLVRNSSFDAATNTLRNGLMGYFTNFDFKPVASAGFFIDSGELYPKLIDVSLTLNVIHEHPLGKKNENGAIVNRAGFDKFPRKPFTPPSRAQQPPEPPPSNNGGVGAESGVLIPQH
jgi:hypothetical protein